MSKIKVEFEPSKDISIVYKDNNIKVSSYLGASEKIFLINKYMSLYFSEEESTGTGYRYLDAEYSLKNIIIQIKTNIDIDSVGNDCYEDVEFWTLFSEKCLWYGQLLKDISILVKMKEKEIERENSTNTFINDLVKKVTLFIEEIGKSSPAEIKKMQDTGLELLDRLEKTSVLGEPQKQNPKKRTPKKSTETTLEGK